MLSVVGNRPQFIKSGPVSEALREAGIEEVVVHTGQHYDPELSQVFFDELGLGEPRYRLEVGGLGREEMLAALRPGLLEAIAAERPDWVLVYGDTNSTLGGARAAGEAGVALAHVEAGLRSYDLSMPEEHNRIETDRLSQLLFAPDERSRATLEAEGVPGRVEVTGDVMADACFRLAPLARERSSILESLGSTPGIRGRHRCTERPTWPSRGSGGSSRGSAGIEEPRRLPGAPADSRAFDEPGVPGCP